jgi:hypothetical protein
VGFLCTPRQGYLAEICTEPADPSFDHTLGGKHDLAGAYCFPCKLPYLLMMSLDTRDPRLGLSFPHGRFEDPLHRQRPLHELPLLYCWSCGPCLDYRINPEGGIDPLNHSKEASWPYSCLPYEPYPKSFPKKHLRLTPMTSRTQELLRKRNAGTLDEAASTSEEDHRSLLLKHQIGGEPRFQQGFYGAKCALCGKPPPFLAAVAETTGSKKKFSPYGVQVLFFYCAPCQVVSTYHDCD